MRLPKLLARREGNALVEFALSAPLIFTVLVGTFQFGYAFYVYNQLQVSVRSGVRYASQLERVFAAFPREQVLVLVFEEFRADNAAGYRQVLEFLGVDPAHEPDFREVHARKAPRSARLNRALNSPRLKRAVFRVLGPRRYDRVSKGVAGAVMRPAGGSTLPPELEAELREELRPDVARTSELVGRDLAAIWGY